jgi:AcrR family transcriptional regulator
VIHLGAEDVASWQRQILLLESQGRVTRTFRRLDPHRQLAVIEAVFAEATADGPHSLQIKRVADRAGVSVGSLYQYFPDREGMLDFAVEVTARFLTEALDGVVPLMAQLPLREGLTAFLSGGVEWSESYAGLLGFFGRSAYAGIPGYAETLVRPIARSMQAMLRALLEGAAARGELRPDLDVEVATRLVLTLCVAVGDAELLPHLNDYFQLFDAAHTPPRIREATVDLILRAIGAETS